ncbi:hypothetical protein QUC31_003036 [Theobroma cacao]|uniref:Methyl esterase 10, putative n=1 Tax=Theobroma cacao TaxID=3641 RepID=A0A061DMV1_THECC|nr:Methyl esterase 10, putative [Theobroma cacao]WRX09583.1 Alpha/beta hydrolase fold-1 - like 10 [Theobroma cacao]
MEKKQRHFVLVHGAFHGAWCWYKVATLLKSTGHKVTALDLAASGVHPKQVHELHSISDYYEPLMEFMASLPVEGKVILVGHSLGGVSLSAAMERFPEKVSVAIFATAVMPGPDFSFASIEEEFTRKGIFSQMDGKYIFDNGPDHPPTSVLAGHNYISSNVYQLSPPEDLMLATVLIRPTALYGGKISLELTKERYGSVRRVYIVCDQDHGIPENLQRWIIENNPPDEVKLVSGSDHMVMFSKPKELCSCLQRIAEKYS